MTHGVLLIDNEDKYEDIDGFWDNENNWYSHIAYMVHTDVIESMNLKAGIPHVVTTEDERYILPKPLVDFLLKERKDG